MKLTLFMHNYYAVVLITGQFFLIEFIKLIIIGIMYKSGLHERIKN